MSEQPTLPSELTLLHAAMTATIKAGMSRLQLVEAYPVLRKGMKLPALLYAMTNLVPGPDPGDGRACVVATFEACILVESSRPQAPLQAAILATQLVKLLRHQFWDMDFVAGVYDVQAMPSESIPDLVQCAAWSVQWRQDVYLGDTEWLWPDEPAGSLQFAPDPDMAFAVDSGGQAPEELA